MPNKVEALEDGIKVTLGASPYWLKFSKSWDNLAPRRFRKVDDLTALKMVIEKTVDWNIPDGEWNPVPFDRARLLAEIDAFLKDESLPCFSIPAQLQTPIAVAYFEAYGEACRLPLENKS